MRILNTGCAELKVAACTTCPKHKKMHAREKDPATGKYYAKLVDVQCTDRFVSVFAAYVGDRVDDGCRLPVATDLPQK